MVNNHINISCLLLQSTIHDFVIFFKRLTAVLARLQEIMPLDHDQGLFKSRNQGKL